MKTTSQLLLSSAVPVLLLAPAAQAQLYQPTTSFFQDYQPPMLYNCFGCGAQNATPSPGTSEVSNGTPNSGNPNYYGTTSSTGPFTYSTSANLSGNFNSEIGYITCTESASMTATAAYGALSASGNASETSSLSTAYFGDFTFSSAGQPVVQFTDKITITPTASNPVGSFVSVNFTDAFTNETTFSVTGPSGQSTAQLVGTLNVSDINAYCGQSFQAGNTSQSGYFVPLAPYSENPAANYVYGNATSVSTSVMIEVGVPTTFTGGLYAVGQASALDDTSEGTTQEGNQVLLSGATQLYINTGGFSYTTASGTIYPSQPGIPTLYIQSLGGQNVMLYWLAVYSNYSLQQTSALGLPDWTATTNAVTFTNEINEVFVTATSNQMFYRLAAP